MTKQSEALRLADAMDNCGLIVDNELRDQIADELRHLHSVNAQLLEALEKLSLYVAHNGDDWVQREARAAIAAVKEMK